MGPSPKIKIPQPLLVGCFYTETFIKDKRDYNLVQFFKKNTVYEFIEMCKFLHKWGRNNLIFSFIRFCFKQRTKQKKVSFIWVNTNKVRQKYRKKIKQEKNLSKNITAAIIAI